MSVHVAGYQGVEIERRLEGMEKKLVRIEDALADISEQLTNLMKAMKDASSYDY